MEYPESNQNTEDPEPVSQKAEDAEQTTEPPLLDKRRKKNTDPEKRSKQLMQLKQAREKKRAMSDARKAKKRAIEVRVTKEMDALDIPPVVDEVVAEEGELEEVDAETEEPVEVEKPTPLQKAPKPPVLKKARPPTKLAKKATPLPPLPTPPGPDMDVLDRGGYEQQVDYPDHSSNNARRRASQQQQYLDQQEVLARERAYHASNNQNDRFSNHPHLYDPYAAPTYPPPTARETQLEALRNSIFGGY
jgi:hypothetical protein